MWIEVETQHSRPDHPARIRRQEEQREQKELHDKCEMSLCLAYWMAMGLLISTAVFLHAAGWM